MTDRIREFLKNRKEEGPCLVLDLDIVRDNYNAFARTLPDTKVYYAVKANPHPEILSLLARLGSSFDVASVQEAQAVLAAGARRTASPTATRSRKRARSPPPSSSASPSSRWTARRRWTRSPAPPPAPA